MRKIPVIIALFFLCRVPTYSQGRTDYMNIEAPQCKPITVARLVNHDYLLVCNTPDNSVEIWDTDESLSPAGRFLARVPVGLEPVTVKYNPTNSCFYTANFLGDSVSMVRISAPTGPGSFTAQLLRTAFVLDEPMDLAFYTTTVTRPDGTETLRQALFVTHMALDAFSILNAKSLAPLSPGLRRIDAIVEETIGDFTVKRAVKEPRTTAVNDDKLFILGNKGGNTIVYDLDLYCLDLKTGTTRGLGGLGSSNLNMSFSSNGDLFVVGGFALNNSLQDEPNVAAAPTGFVKSMFYFVQGAGTDFPSVQARDLNARFVMRNAKSQPFAPVPPELASDFGPAGDSFKTDVEPLMVPVGKKDALAQPTDVLPFEEGGNVTKVFFTAFGSDRIGWLLVNPNLPPTRWKLRRMSIRPVPGNGNRTAGPRALALKYPASSPDDPGSRLYVMNRLDNSVTIVDPIGEKQVGEFALHHDPTPEYVRRGRPYLYDARLSGNGFSSCASCHIDGRTDGHAWDLGTPLAKPEPIPEILKDAVVISEFPADKGEMVTQSLQGLLNFEVDPENRAFVTNAPYHWRGDRADFTKFNPAFVSLLGRSKELPEEAMNDFEEFINSIHYPPNPKQPLDRKFSGDFGDEQSANDPSVGSGAQLGLKLFHIAASDGPRGCVHCHALPEGSNNRITEILGEQPIETAAMRGLFQKEARLDKTGSDKPSDSPLTGFEGLIHTGKVIPSPFDAEPFNELDFNAVASINGFNRLFFSQRICGQFGEICEDLASINQFCHEMDWGVGPLVGTTVTLDLASEPSWVKFATEFGETQAELANVGIAVHAWIGGGTQGFWYDLTGESPVYRREPHGTSMTKEELLALLETPVDRLVFTGTPLGSERRVASPNGSALPLPGPNPTSLTLLGMKPNTSHQDVPLMTQLWDNETLVLGSGPGALKSLFLHTVRVFQWGLIQDAAKEGGFGIDTVRHDAPRRFRVAGKRIRHGAKLSLFVPVGNDGPPDLTSPPEVEGQVKTIKLSLPIHPTGKKLDDGRTVWETTVELEPMVYCGLMLGGPGAPGVLATFQDFELEIPDPPPFGLFDPIGWNWHFVEVENADGTVGVGRWQRLTLD